MKTQSKFKALPTEEQQQIIDLCEQYTYHEVVELLARPRPEGLALQTSYSALRRFYTTHHPDTLNLESLHQYAHTLRIARQNADGSFYTGILALVESRILEALRRGRAIVDLKTEFDLMVKLQKAFLAHEKWHAQAGAKRKEAFRQFHDQTAAEQNNPDFQPIELPEPDTPTVDSQISNSNSLPSVHPAETPPVRLGLQPASETPPHSNPTHQTLEPEPTTTLHSSSTTTPENQDTIRLIHQKLAEKPLYPPFSTLDYPPPIPADFSTATNNPDLP